MRRMRNIHQHVITASLASICTVCLLVISCVNRYCVYGEPDQDRFQNLVRSQRLVDSLQHHALTKGMPYFVVRDIFRSCDGDTGIPVASIGSRQKLDETEGLYSHYHDPSIEVWLDRYTTERGDLLIWYGNPTFYRSQIMEKDTIYLFGENGCDTARVYFLLDPSLLRLTRQPRGSSFPYAEVHSRRQNGLVNFFYNLSMVDSNLVTINPQKRSEYPVYRLEMNNNEIQSFKWR
jgi:hypothetical protein